MERPRVKIFERSSVRFESLGLSQSEIIDLLQYPYELTQGMLSNVELGKHERSLLRVVAHAKLARISINFLLDDAKTIGMWILSTLGSLSVGRSDRPLRNLRIKDSMNIEGTEARTTRCKDFQLGKST
jgi:hypothetical protein